jgi:hypothetical protein
MNAFLIILAQVLTMAAFGVGLGLGVGFGFAVPCFAVETTSNVPHTSTFPGILRQKEFDETHAITDARLKAENGSLSRYSMKLKMTYRGPVLANIEEKDQPNPDGSVGSFATAFSGKLAGRYRLDSTSTVSAGTGLKALYPFHGIKRVDVNNPYLSFDKSRRVSGIQMRTSPIVTLTTFPEQRRVGNFANVGLEHTMTYDLGTSRFAVDFDTTITYLMYGRSYRKTDKKSLSYALSASPSAKYRFTDRFNLHTSFNFEWQNLRRSASSLALQNTTPTEKVGLGYALSRDFYFAPNVEFYPDHLSPNATTLNFTAIISL